MNRESVADAAATPPRPAAPEEPASAEPITAPPGVLPSHPEIRVPPAGDTLAPPIPQQEHIARCRGPAQVRVTEAERNQVTLARLRHDGKRTVIAVDEGEHGLAVNKEGTRAASTKGVLNLKSGSWKPISGSERWRWPAFIPTTDLLVTHVANDAGEVSRALVVDSRTGKTVHETTGYAHAVTRDGALVYVEPEATSSPDRESRYADVLVYEARKVRHVARIPTPSGDHSLAVTDVSARSADEIVYRISETHEHRFLNIDGTAFYSGGHGHLTASPDGGAGLSTSKEQYNLSFSTDGHYAAFAERTWNQLTYIVLVDLRKKKRIELPYYGSFPAVSGQTLYFSSDPSFVRAPAGNRHDLDTEPVAEVAFREIQDWGLYAFDIPTKRLCLVRMFDHYVQATP